MSDLAVLIVPENNRQFRQLEKSIRGVGVGEIRPAADGDEAVRWLSVRRCDACVLSYELPGKRNGLDTLLDIRTHQPDLPVIMISRSGSEKVAVGAFHAGVVDYVPISRGYEHAVASLISQIKVTAPNGHIVPTQIIPPGVHDLLLQPTYQNRLRVIGHHLDFYNFRRISILEVDGGFIARATQSGSRDIETLEFVDQNFPQLLASAASERGGGERRSSIPNQLIPTGYEDFLRAIGHLLDEHAAEAITISELDGLAVVSGLGRVDETGLTRFGQMQWLYRAEDVADLLDGAYRRRRQTAMSQSSRSGGILRRLSG